MVPSKQLAMVPTGSSVSSAVTTTVRGGGAGLLSCCLQPVAAAVRQSGIRKRSVWLTGSWYQAGASCRQRPQIVPHLELATSSPSSFVLSMPSIMALSCSASNTSLSSSDSESTTIGLGLAGSDKSTLTCPLSAH